MTKLKAILLDLDGTLRDTRDIIYPALQHALQAHTGKQFSREQIAPYVHYHREVHEKLAGEVDQSAFIETYATRVKELMPSVRLYTGVVEMLKALRESGYKIGLVSSATHASADLEQFGLSGYFDAIVGGMDTVEHKPHPEPVLLALKKLQVHPSKALMVGDLTADIQAAHAAGVKLTIGLTHGFGTREELEAAGADFVVDALGDLTTIIARIEA